MFCKVIEKNDAKYLGYFLLYIKDEKYCIS